MKRLILLLAMLAALIFSFFPLIIVSAYLFTGGDRQSMLDLLTKIPAHRFWLFAVPLTFSCFGATLWLFYKTFDYGLSRKEVIPEKKQIYYLEDDNLGDKLTDVIISRPETTKTPLSFEEQYANAFQQ
jgi:predicted membrane protein